MKAMMPSMPNVFTISAWGFGCVPGAVGDGASASRASNKFQCIGSMNRGDEFRRRTGFGKSSLGEFARQPAGQAVGMEKGGKCQGDHGGCGAKYRCCLPAL